MRPAPIALLVLAAAACGGSNAPVANPPPPASPSGPAIASLAPDTGAAATAVVITGTGFTGATAVRFNGTAATFTVRDDAHLDTAVPAGATTGTVTVVTGGGSATSPAPFVVSPPGPAIASLAPDTGVAATAVVITGKGFTGATAVRFNGTAATFTVRDDAHLDTAVPAGATTGAVTVVTGSGTLTSPAPFVVPQATGVDLAIDGLYLTQATQNYPAHDVPLVKDRSAWVRVFVRAAAANTLAPQVRVTFSGTVNQTLLIPAPGASVPTAVDPGNAATSWNAAVPAAWMQPGVQVEADLRGTSDPVPANDHLAAQALDVRAVPTFKVTLVPVLTGSAQGAVVTGTRTLANWVDPARRLHAMPDVVDVVQGSTMTSSVTSLAADGTGWNTVLSEVDTKRTLDGVSDRNYYGVVATSYSSGVAGLGYVGYPVAIGWDKPSAGYGGGANVMAHEVGHNFNRPHSPCGNPSGVDPSYPTTGDYAGGHIGVPGWDAFAPDANLKPAATWTDIMGYCNTQWVSDYVYKSVLAYREGHASIPALALAAAGAGQPGRLVWGTISAAGAVLEPSFEAPFRGELPEPGPWRWEARDAAGRVLAAVDFAAREVADGPGGEVLQFSFVAPLSEGDAPAVQSHHLLSPEGHEVARQVRRQAGTGALAPSIRALAGGGRLVTWDASRHPLVMVRDAATGEVRGFGRGGALPLRDGPAQPELHLSDGVDSVALRQP